MALRGLLHEVLARLVPGQDPAVGRWLSLELFPATAPAGSARNWTRSPRLTYGALVRPGDPRWIDPRELLGPGSPQPVAMRRTTC